MDQSEIPLKWISIIVGTGEVWKTSEEMQITKFVSFDGFLVLVKRFLAD